MFRSKNSTNSWKSARWLEPYRNPDICTLSSAGKMEALFPVHPKKLICSFLVMLYIIITSTSGHVVGEMVVHTTAEIVIGNCEEANFGRVTDEISGYKELIVSSNHKE